MRQQQQHKKRPQRAFVRMPSSRHPPTISLLIATIIILISSTMNNIIPPVDAFATYLLGNVGCMTELSTDEVIMNGQVVSATASSHPKVHMAVVAESLNLVSRTEAMEDGGTRIFLHPPPTTDIDYSIRIELELNTADYHPMLKDIQFVVDVSGGGGIISQASMVDGQCDDNTRVTGRDHDTVTLELTKLAAADIAETDEEPQPVQVWAGWATGHEAVRLTPILEFQFDAAIAAPATSGGGDADQEQQDGALGEDTPPIEKETETEDIVVKKEEADQNDGPLGEDTPPKEEGKVEDIVVEEETEDEADEESQRGLGETEKADLAKHLNAYQHDHTATKKVKGVVPKSSSNSKQRSNLVSSRRQDLNNNNSNKRPKSRGNNNKRKSMSKQNKSKNSNKRPKSKRRSHHHGTQTQSERDRDEAERQELHESRKAKRDIYGQRQRKTMDDIKQHQNQNAQAKAKTKTKSERDNNNSITMDTTWFLYGLGILVVGNILVIQVCTYVSGGRGDAKGRRSL